jgi:Protein kinase domain
VTIIDTLGPGSTLVGDYKIIRVLGSGGFGNTYLAMDHNLNREVAIKEFFPRDIAFREDQTTVSIKSPRFQDNFKWGLERFVQEAKLLAKFRHPNIVRVFRTFEANHTSYIVLDFVRGPNVETWLQRLNRQPTQQELDELVAPLTDALALLHEAGVLHRDIKPANICIREETGDPVLLDFGASKYSMSEMTGTTAAIVSRGYSPYEAYAADSKQQGAWTDIYALGATVYRALTGGSPPEATERRLNDTIVPLRSQRLPGLRPEFLAAVDWALTVQPRARPQSIAEWQPRLLAGSGAASNWQARRLQGGGSYVGEEASGARSKATVPMPGTAAARPSRRRTVALAFVLLLLLGGGTLAMWQIQEQQREEIRRQDEARRNTEAEAQRLAEARKQAEEDARRRAEANRADEERRQSRKAAEEERQAAIKAAAAKAEQEEAERQAKKREQQEERQAAIRAAAAKAEQEEAERQAKKREQQEERQAAIKAAAAKAEQEEAERQAKKREQQEERGSAAKAATAARAAAAAEPDERPRNRKREPEKRVERKRSISQGSSSPRSAPSGQAPAITGIR